MKISEDKKIEVLLAALKERYEALHKIRDRVQASGIWILGILMGASGWLLQSDKSLTISEKLVFIVATLLAFLFFRFDFLADLRKGFTAQQRAAAAIETKLGLYEEALYGEDGSTVYPLTWKDAGTKEGDGKFFDTVYHLLWIGTLFLVISICLNGGSFGTQHIKKKIPHLPYCERHM